MEENIAYLKGIGLHCDEEEIKELKFDMRFSPSIIDGNKNNTIRRDTNLLVGESVKLVAIEPKAGGVDYFDLRVVTITSILPVLIDYESRSVLVSSIMLEPEQIGDLFHDNGWGNVEDGFEYYKSMYGKTFKGVNIQWD